jgi:glycerol dehydrogenase-like iron-containing ADH family enzyme
MNSVLKSTLLLPIFLSAFSSFANPTCAVNGFDVQARASLLGTPSATPSAAAAGMPAEFDFVPGDTLEAVGRLARPNSIIITDDYNYETLAARFGSSRVLRIDNNTQASWDSLSLRSGDSNDVVGVGGCTALDAARHVAGAGVSRTVGLVPTIISSACVSVNKAIVQDGLTGINRAVLTPTPREVIVPMRTILETQKEVRDKWIKSAVFDVLARYGGAIDYSFRRGVLSTESVVTNSPTTSDFISWVMRNWDGGVNEDLVRRVAGASHETSSLTVVRGNSELSVGAEHKFYDYLVSKQHQQNAPGSNITGTHGEIVGIGTLIEARVMGELTGDMRVYDELTAIYRQLDLPISNSRLGELGLTRTDIEAGLRAVSGTNTVLGTYFRNGDYSLLDRIFGVQVPTP